MYATWLWRMLTTVNVSDWALCCRTRRSTVFVTSAAELFRGSSFRMPMENERGGYVTSDQFGAAFLSLDSEHEPQRSPKTGQWLSPEKPANENSVRDIDSQGGL